MDKRLYPTLIGGLRLSSISVVRLLLTRGAQATRKSGTGPGDDRLVLQMKNFHVLRLVDTDIDTLVPYSSHPAVSARIERYLHRPEQCILLNDNKRSCILARPTTVESGQDYVKVHCQWIGCVFRNRTPYPGQISTIRKGVEFLFGTG